MFLLLKFFREIFRWKFAWNINSFLSIEILFLSDALTWKVLNWTYWRSCLQLKKVLVTLEPSLNFHLTGIKVFNLGGGFVQFSFSLHCKLKTKTAKENKMFPNRIIKVFTPILDSELQTVENNMRYRKVRLRSYTGLRGTRFWVILTQKWKFSTANLFFMWFMI